jgi:hypothetical protein
MTMLLGITWEQEKEGCSTPEPFDLGGSLAMILGCEIARNHVGHATVNPASNGSAWDVQLRK